MKKLLIFFIFLSIIGYIRSQEDEISKKILSHPMFKDISIQDYDLRIAQEILSKEKLTIDYIEQKCIDINTLKEYNITPEDSKLRYYVKIILGSSRKDDAELEVNGGINFKFNTYCDVVIEDQFYRPFKTFISKNEEFFNDNTGNYITFPSIPSKTVYWKNGDTMLQTEYLKLNVLISKESLYELENLINNIVDRNKISIYLITASDLRKGDKYKDNVKLYIKQEYRYRLRDYFIANKVRMVIFNNETGKLYYDNLFVPASPAKKKK